MVAWSVAFGFNATFTAKVKSWWYMLHTFPGLLTPVLTQLFFPKPPTTFLTCFSRGERRKYARKKVRLNQVSNSKAPGQESDTLTPEPPWRAQWNGIMKVLCNEPPFRCQKKILLLTGFKPGEKLVENK